MVALRLGFLLVASCVFSRAASAGPILDHETKLFSNGNEELVIRDYFKDARDGFFLDVGCSLPRKYSNTFYLERRLGWSGIGIDAVAKYAAGWKKLRPRSKFFTYLVTDHSGTRDRFFESGYIPVSSMFRDLVDHHAYEEIEVESITLDDLLEREGVEKIDFMSLDIEGAGLLALRGFDIQKYKPELLCVEPVEDKAGLLAYFRERGYRWRRDFLKYDFGNWYFEPTDRPLLTRQSLPTWTRSGDATIVFEMDGRDLVARVPAGTSTEAVALLCSRDGFEEFFLDVEMRPSAAGMTGGAVVRELTPGGTFADALGALAGELSDERWTRLRVTAAGEDTGATLDGQPLRAAAESRTPTASVCLAATGAATDPAVARELRWRKMRVGPAA